MENINQNFDDCLKNKRLENYLTGLKDRLKHLLHQQNEVILNSLKIINEIDQVSTSLSKRDNASENQVNITRIKALIQEFENAKVSKVPIQTKSPLDIDSTLDIRKTLNNFEVLNRSHILKDGVVLFKRAKEAFEKIDKIFGHMTYDCIACTSTGSVRDKVNLFNNAIGSTKGSRSGFASCCSSISSIDTFHSIEEFRDLAGIKPHLSTTTSLEKGYEGDNDDSDFKLKTAKKLN